MRKPIEEAVFKVVRDALIVNDGDRQKTAAYLGCTIRTIYNYCHKWTELDEFVTDVRGTKSGNERWERLAKQEQEYNTKRRRKGIKDE